MKRKNLVFLFCCLLIPSGVTGGDAFRVKAVYDGDTILLERGQRVRYAGIDAPEIDHEGGQGEFMAEEARQFNEALVRGTTVRIELDREKRDRYGRLLAYVYLDNGHMVNALMVKRGYAHVLPKRPNLKHFDLLLKLQREAISSGLGIWRGSPGKGELFYVASRRSFRFHRPTCPFGRRIPPRNQVLFRDRKGAFWDGFSPCKRCNP